MSSMFDQFETNDNLERDGIWIDYGDFRVKAAHAGGSNKNYQKFAEMKMKPLRRAIASGTIDDRRAQIILHEIYAKTIIKDWQYLDGKDKDGNPIYKSGIPTKEGEPIEVNEKNIIHTFKLLPALFNDIQSVATEISGYLAADLEEDAKN